MEGGSKVAVETLVYYASKTMTSSIHALLRSSKACSLHSRPTNLLEPEENRLICSKKI